MRFSLETVSAGSALSVVLLLPLAPVRPSRKRMLQRPPRHGRGRLATTIPITCCRISGDAALWRTLSPTVRADRAALGGYFVTTFKVLPDPKVALGDQLIRVYGDTASTLGITRFRTLKTEGLSARYSFTHVKNSEHWLIVDHYASAMPAPPK
jgi:hypothetical protein